ncbi:MAG: tetratricopeptide repeat protein, partial [Syntrophaceae bacterium]|nr:tetratricopeptide repeat protein [Syntrophaceae bacterium]
LRKEINAFQSDLTGSRSFFLLYGPVTFKDDDEETTLDFIRQLIQIKEDEMAEALEQQQQEVAAKVSGDLQERVSGIMALVEKGEFSTARDETAKDDEAADALIELYNDMGIQYRKEKKYDKAVAAFKKAIFIRPEDEGLYYNMARAYIEATDWKSAKNTMEEVLQIQPEFSEGRRLLQLIDQNLAEEGHPA